MDETSKGNHESDVVFAIQNEILELEIVGPPWGKRFSKWKYTSSERGVLSLWLGVQEAFLTNLA